MPMAAMPVPAVSHLSDSIVLWFVYIIKGLFLMHPFPILSAFVAIKVNKVTVPFQPKSIPSRSRFSHAYVSNIDVFYKKAFEWL